jgi:hypothetical protein
MRTERTRARSTLYYEKDRGTVESSLVDVHKDREICLRNEIYYLTRQVLGTLSMSL